MLRISVLLLLLANGLYFAWAEGLFEAYGLAPTAQSEPQRLAQQIRPETLRVASATLPQPAETQASAASAQATAATCLQAGVFDEAQAALLRQALEPALPSNSWTLEPVVVPGRWIVYMGKYASAELVERKRGELRALQVRFEVLANASLEPGLSLGGFDSADAAGAELNALTRRGVRTAKVMEERHELRGSRLRLPAADTALKTRVQELGAALAGKPLVACE